VPAVLADHAHSALVRSLLSMALAKTGSTLDWTTIADHLQLLATHAHRIGRLIAHLDRQGSWPVLAAALERLTTGLQQHPPPINYPARRAVGHNLDLLTAAVETGRHRHPTTVPTETLQRQLWERLTGGDIAYAPLPIRIELTSPNYRTFRRLHGVRESDLFHVAHHHLRKTTDVTGPLIWRPQLLPDLTTPGSDQAPLRPSLAEHHPTCGQVAVAAPLPM